MRTSEQHEGTPSRWEPTSGPSRLPGRPWRLGSCDTGPLCKRKGRQQSRTTTNDDQNAPLYVAAVQKVLIQAFEALGRGNVIERGHHYASLCRQVFQQPPSTKPTLSRASVLPPPVQTWAASHRTAFQPTSGSTACVPGWVCLMADDEFQDFTTSTPWERYVYLLLVNCSSKPLYKKTLCLQLARRVCKSKPY